MRYSQIFLDISSKKIWTVRLKLKSDSDKAIAFVLDDSKIRSGRKCKFLKTDGDGIFRSKSFLELKEKYGFVHERSAPYDHEQSAMIDRECRTLLEAVSTSLAQSGAPLSFWGHAAAHFTFTKNNTPRHEILKDNKTIFISPNNMHENIVKPFNLQHLVAFGTQANCFISPEARKGSKTPGQVKSFEGIIIGYVEGMGAYKIFDILKNKIREVSFYFTVVTEGSFPFRERKNWPKEIEKEKEPINFIPHSKHF